jgi:hypothetical protein
VRKLAAAEGLAQVEALTRGIDLPRHPLGVRMAQQLSIFITDGWTALLANNPQSAIDAAEPSVSSLLLSELLALRRTKRWKWMVRSIHGGSNQMNFDGTLIEKSPDLLIDLTDEEAIFPVIVECKIVNALNDQTVQLYCEKGIDRFVRGDYAWMNREGFMLAYVRDASVIATHLAPYLARTPAHGLVGEPAAFGGARDIAITIHDRNFLFPTRVAPNNRPGPIELHHLWFA